MACQFTIAKKSSWNFHLFWNHSHPVETEKTSPFRGSSISVFLCTTSLKSVFYVKTNVPTKRRWNYCPFMTFCKILQEAPAFIAIGPFLAAGWMLRLFFQARPSTFLRHPARLIHHRCKNSRSGHLHGTAACTGRQDRFNGWLPEPAWGRQ